MFSLRSASLVATFAVFGSMGCAASSFQGVGQPQTGASLASYDPSSVYQPSPNSRPLAVAPPVTVTGAVGEGPRETRTAHCAVAEGSVGVSPNARLCP